MISNSIFETFLNLSPGKIVAEALGIGSNYCPSIYISYCLFIAENLAFMR